MFYAIHEMNFTFRVLNHSECVISCVWLCSQHHEHHNQAKFDVLIEESFESSERLYMLCATTVLYL